MRTKKQVFAKLGKLELSRRVPVPPKAAPKSVQLAAKNVNRPGVVVGKSGNTGVYGMADTGEYLKKLQGAAGRATFDEMRRSDPVIGGVLFAIGLPIRQANYYVEPVSDNSTDVEIAETIQRGLLEDMTITWDDTIRHILLMFPFGFSVLEKVWELRDGFVQPRKLDPRLPQSIVGWKTGPDGLIGPTQMDEGFKEIVLPIEKLLVFSTDKEGDNWEGIPLLRRCYKPWFIKNTLEKVNAIKHERHGVGIPVMDIPENITQDSKEWQDVEDVLSSVQANEQAYVITPNGYTFRIEGGQGKEGTDALPSIKYYDEVIAKALIAMFMSLGSTDTGSRALGGEFLDIFRLSIQSFADYICEVINRFAVKQYVDFNWNVKEYPRLKVRRIQRLDPQVLAVLKNAGLITGDEEIENTIRDELNLPDKQTEEPQGKKPVKKEKPDPDAGDDDDDDQHSSHDHGLHLSTRDPNAFDQLADLDAIEYALDSATESLQTELTEWRDKQLDKIILQVVGGRQIQDIAVPHKKDMHAALLKEYKSQLKEAKKQAVEEMQRQVPMKKLADTPLPDLTEMLRIIEEELTIKIQGASDKLKTTIATQALDLKKKGLTGEELKGKLIESVNAKVTDAPVKELASTAVNQGWGEGRQLGMEAYADEIEDVYRSGLLDSNLCSVCRPKDQVRHELGDPEYMTPDPECEGGPGRCRCINIAIMKAESAPEGE